jgi:hypothetical protein
MRLYIAVIESDRRKGRRVKIAIHARSKKAALSMLSGRYNKWTLRNLNHAPGPKFISFQDEFPD